MSNTDSTCAAAQSQTTVEYREIPGFPGYRVGNDGSVWSCKKSVPLGRGLGTRIVLTDRWKLLSSRRTNGYPRVDLCHNGKHRNRHVHELVMEAFVGPRPEGAVICHYDDDPTNAHLDNLRYAAFQDNEADKLRNGNRPLGSRVYGSKLTEDQVREIRRLLLTMIPEHVGPLFGINPATVAAIGSGETWGWFEPEWLKEHREAYRQMNRLRRDKKHVCTFCGKEFIYTHSRQKTCSTKCAHALSWQKRRSK